MSYDVRFMNSSKCPLTCDCRTSDGHCYSTGFCNRYFNYLNGVQDTSSKPIETFMKYGKFSVSSKEDCTKDITNNKELDMKRTKLYKVEFLEYTNSCRDTVSNKYESTSKIEYLDVSDKPFIIKEDDIDYFKQFGKGFASLVFVGYLGEIDGE